jgi:hypothetical protein
MTWIEGERSLLGNLSLNQQAGEDASRGTRVWTLAWLPECSLPEFSSLRFQDESRFRILPGGREDSARELRYA